MNWLEKIYDDMSKWDAVCVFGSLSPDIKNGKYKLSFFLVNLLYFLGSKTNVFHNVCAANAAFRKKEFLDIDGFRDLPAGDDVEISVRLREKGRIFFDPRLWVIFSVRRIEKLGFLQAAMLYLGIGAKMLFGKSDILPKNYAKQIYD